MDGCAARAALEQAEVAKRAPAPGCTPLVKWVGGKGRLLPELVRRMPARYERYFEPFAGGLALFFHLAPQRAFLGDANADLMATYRAVAADPERVIGRLHGMSVEHEVEEGFYYRLRAAWNERRATWPADQRAAALLYFNRTCYNGLWRTNKAGGMNAPRGRYTNPTICDPERILACAKVLRQAELWTADYQQTTCDARRGDFVYFDPPYIPASPTASFTNYTPGGFGARCHHELAELAQRLVARGVQVMLSNADVPMVRRLYKGWKIDRVRAARSINARADKRGAVGEVIITGGYDIPRRRR
jgi:DNA adenine methylase